MPRTRKNHPPSLKAKVAIEAIKAQKTTTQISPNVRRSPNPSRRLEETSLGRFAERLRYSSPEWMAAFGPPPGWPAPPSKDTPDFVQTMGSTSVCHRRNKTTAFLLTRTSGEKPHRRGRGTNSTSVSKSAAASTICDNGLHGRTPLPVLPAGIPALKVPAWAGCVLRSVMPAATTWR